MVVDRNDLCLHDALFAFSAGLRFLRSGFRRTGGFLECDFQQRFAQRRQNDFDRNVHRRTAQYSIRARGGVVYREIPILGKGNVDFSNRPSFRHFPDYRRFVVCISVRISVCFGKMAVRA